jgi:hypothetical protein
LQIDTNLGSNSSHCTKKTENFHQVIDGKMGGDYTFRKESETSEQPIKRVEFS